MLPLCYGAPKSLYSINNFYLVPLFGQMFLQHLQVVFVTDDFFWERRESNPGMVAEKQPPKFSFFLHPTFVEKFSEVSEIDARRIEDDVDRFASTSPSVPIPTTPCKFGADPDGPPSRQAKRSVDLIE